MPQQTNPFDDILSSPPAGPSGFSRHGGRHTGTRDPFAEPDERGIRIVDEGRARQAQQFSLDPFFDDEDDFPSSSHQRGYLPPANAASASDFDLPLARAGEVPAGFDGPLTGETSSTYNGQYSHGGGYDEPDFKKDVLDSPPTGNENVESLSWDFTASGSSGPPRRKFFVSKIKSFDYTLGLGRGSFTDLLPGRKGDSTEPRTIWVNDAPRNLSDGRKWKGNSVSTSKYNIITFLPKFIFEQFSKYANLFFLFTACIQQIPNVSPTSRYTTILPLGLVLLASAFKELEEDLKRHSQDRQLNANLTKVLQPVTGSFEPRSWKNVKVGDILRLDNDDFIPADMVLLASSEPEGLCYVETSNLDGETNLKIKQASPSTAHLISPSSIARISGHLLSEAPNSSLYTYEGTLHMQSSGQEKILPLGPDQMLLRGAQIRNTSWLYGMVVSAGHQTKLMKNATTAPVKRTAVEKQVNNQIILLFVLLLILSVVSTVGSSIRTWFFSSQSWYLRLGSDTPNKAKQFVEDILTFIILYNNLIPISLIVTMEVVKFQQAQLINSDLDMYYEKTDTPAVCRTSSLVEELGQIEYIFSDKTGTLTCNEMEFRECSIAGTMYAQTVDEAKREQGQQNFSELQRRAQQNDGEGAAIREFLTMLSVCHTVIPETKGEKIIYQASSPDEAALVSGAELLGYRFRVRKPKSVYVDINGDSVEFQILNVCEFNSSRKRMSTIVRMPDGSIKIYCKGADTVIYERLAANQGISDATLVHLEDYATEGLRTLCLAYRNIPEEEYREWSAMYNKAAAQINGRAEALEKVAEIIEQNLVLLGATAIEDKLQDGVPDTIHTLQQAGIKIWVLTGDRQETAINIGMSCRLISESMNLIIVNEQSAADTEDFLSKRLFAIKNQRKAGDTEELALVIDGKTLDWALDKEISKIFLELAIMCKAVICCRVSPLQKALVVKLVKKNQKAILLAIGDGANDVSMIQAAHVGVGISGVEGLQAARSADVAISQFRFLKKLLLVHGAWSYTRLSKLILYSFYKNIVLYMTQFWYSLFNDYSGQITFESWTWSGYNVVFTILPPLVIGIFDQFVSARMLDRYPQLYHLGQSNTFFTPRAFWQWVLNAFYHSLLLFTFSLCVFWGDLIQHGGRNIDLWFWGTTLYLMVLVTVLGKAAIISDLWTKYTLAAIPGSFFFTLLTLPLYALIAPHIGISKEYIGLVPRLWSDPVFYFCLLVFPVICLLRDFVWKYYRRTYLPQNYHIVQEIQKFNLSDYRPRQEQFQKAIKKVRATQRMRRQRGFAFSQTEGGAQSQAGLIRAYDTSVERPTGY